MVGWIKNHMFMESVARPSIVEVRGDGPPRFARSDENFLLSETAFFAHFDGLPRSS